MTADTCNQASHRRCTDATGMNRKASMRLQRFLSFVSLAPLLCSCAIHDGVFIYKVSGTLVGENSAPLDGRPMYVQIRPFDSSDTSVHNFVSTDLDGKFAQNAATGLAWGYRSLFGIPLGSKIPPIPLLSVIYIAVERSPGSWIQLSVPITAAQQPERGTVHLGEVRVIQSSL